jgi:hypothetical protein
MTTAVVERWVEVPLRRFVEDAQAVLALLLTPSGQVLAQHGFTRAVDVMSACALAAAIHASSTELGMQLQGRPFAALHHAGRRRQLFLTKTLTGRATYVFLTVFDEASSLGLVQLYYDEFAARLAAAAPAPTEGPVDVLSENFEQDLNRNLALLFRR